MMTRKELAKAKAQVQRFAVSTQAQRLDDLARVREQVQRCKVAVAPPAKDVGPLLLMGVYYTRRRDTPWKVRIRVDGRMTTMGWYATIDEAAAVARDGQPSRLNSGR
jgi:hypothetical protein